MKILENKKVKYALVVCVGLCVAALLTAMLLRPEDPNAKGNLTSSQGEMTGTHFYKVYSDKFIADAEVTTDYNDKAKVVYAKPRIYDEKKLLSLFFKGKNPVREHSKKGDFSENISYTDSGINDEYISIFKFNTSYRASGWRYYELPKDGLSAEYERYYSLLPTYSEKYKQEELSFMSHKEAIKKAKETLKKLDINVTDDVEIYAIDHKTMQTYQEEKMKERPDSVQFYHIKETFTEDDEFYMMYFQTVYDGVPVTLDNYEMWDGDRGINGSVVTVYLSKKGIINFEARSVYEIEGVAETPKSILTPEQAVDKVFDIYNSFVTDEKITIREVRFEYMPIAYNDNLLEVKLTPAWLVVLSSDLSEDRGVITHRRINAVTGEEIN